MNTTKIIVTTSLTTIGTVSPYSYQVKPKTYGTTKQVEFDGEARQTRFTKGQGKGDKVKYYAYFMVDSFQHWIELTVESYNELTKNPAAILTITRATPAPAPAAVEPAPAEPATPAEPVQAEPAPATTKRGRKAQREVAAAE